MSIRISKQLLEDAVPDSLNWNNIRDAYRAMTESERFKKTIDCGQNLRGMNFEGHFNMVHGKILGRLSPIELTKDRSGKAEAVIRHTNLIRERWMVFS